MAGLTLKQQAFVEAYLTTWNASQAARDAAYAQPYSQGPRLLENVEIAAVIAARLAERAMTANEVLDRLAAHGRGTMADFVDVRTGMLDLEKAAAAGKLGLIKKFSTTQTDKSTHVGIELYDAQAALELLGKAHGLFKDRVEHGGAIGTYHINIGLPDDSSTIDI